MDQELFNPQSSSVTSSRILYTSSTFARTSLLHLQEVGLLQAIDASHNVTVDYVFQDINDIPGSLPEGRTKPWGTGQVVLVAKS